MPSPHTASSPSERQATGSAKQPSSVVAHHQTVYNSDRGHCIVEGRSRMVRAAKAPSSASACRPATSLSHATPTQERHSAVGFVNFPSPPASPRECPGLAPHVTFAKHSHKPKVVVVASPRMSSKQLPGDDSAFKGWEEPTPPPTPRLGRLPTPDLSDLEDAPFCGCDSKATIVRYCTSCKKHAEPCSSWFCYGVE